MNDNIFDIAKRKVEEIEASSLLKIKRAELAKMIDHTLLKPDATFDMIDRLIEEGIKWKVKSLCVPPAFVPYVKTKLEGSNVLLCSVIAFPLGYTLKGVKQEEARRLIGLGVDELDMVINIAFLKDNRREYTLDEIRSIKEVMEDKVLKVIIETSLLTDEEKVRACELVVEAGADFVKTSTGFGPGGATLYDVALLKEVVKNKAKVKAAGGIRTYEDAVKMIMAGASRLGTSSGVKILEQAPI